MAMYRDSQLGICIDITGPDGNIFFLWAIAHDLAQQLEREVEWRETLNASKTLSKSYLLQLNVFKEFFPMVTLIGYDEVVRQQLNWDSDWTGVAYE